ncbi:MAG: Tim44-like domain-containing protein, partial [Candidatus Protistobacter heckmanni]|nr:Tim44-like domain-containing protein [Candidatus Protistobacter heckmanni]
QQPSRWGGIGSMLGGLAAGIGLGYLFSHFGGDLFGGAGMGGFLMLLAALAIGVWLFRRMAASQTPAYAGGPQAQAGQPPLQSIPAPHQPYETQTYTPAVAAAPAALQGMENWGIPQGFDTETFLRNAKSNFVRLQGDWDAGNLDDLRDLTTPEMFTEIRTQVSNRVGRDKTEVVTLDADLLGIEQTSEEYIASVRFGGMIRENQGGPAESFSEVWNLVRPADGKTGWLLAGIQQIQ